VALAPRDDTGQQEALAAARDDLGLTCEGVDWFSGYRVHHRVAATFRKGPVFLAGDAGHVHSPVGGQGMNTGLQDAHNLALLLADVRQERLDAAALGRYEQERRPVAIMLVKVTDRLFGLIGRRNRRTARLRRRVSGIGAYLAPRLLGTRFGRRIGGYLLRRLEPSQDVAWRRSTSHLAAIIVADCRRESRGVGLHWLPVWLPKI